jgi:hypothetical protein
MAKTELLAPTDDPRRFISTRAWIRDENEVRVIFSYDHPIVQYLKDDRAMERFAAALLVQIDAANVNEVAAAFKMHRVTVTRNRKRLEKGGLAAMFDGKPGPKGPHKFGIALRRQVVALRQDQETYEAIATRLGMSKGIVVAICAQAGLVKPAADTPMLPELEGAKTPLEPEAPTRAGEDDVPVYTVPAVPPAVPAEEPLSLPPPRSREEAWVEARLCWSPEGEERTCFEASSNVRHAGVLLAFPFLSSLGLLEGARAVYGRMTRVVYGVRAIFLVLYAMALLRVKRPEWLKGIFPDALGRVLGLLRVPEVRTLRRKLRSLAFMSKAHELVKWLGRRRAQEAPQALGFLYADGHVRAYYGKKWLPKAFLTTRKQVLPATTDYWINDRDGQPVLVLPTEANLALVKALPMIVAAVRGIIGPRRRVTIVFDRGGWSPKLFRKLLMLGFDILTYRKGPVRPLPRWAFREETTQVDGKKHTYLLAEATTRIKGAPLLRRIAVRRKDGQATEIITSRMDLSAALLAYRMFERWRQENFFKYMEQEFAIDGLIDYTDEPADPERTVPNPRKATISKEVAEARADVARLEQELGAMLEENVESKCKTLRGFKIAHAKKRGELSVAKQTVAALQKRLRGIPARVAVKTLAPEGQAVVKLALERKLITDAVKMAAYRAESKLVELVRPYFARTNDEGRRFIKEALALSGDLDVDGTDVTVRLHPMSAPRFTRALEALCRELNGMDTRFPESRYRLRFAVRTPE